MAEYCETAVKRNADLFSRKPHLTDRSDETNKTLLCTKKLEKKKIKDY